MNHIDRVQTLYQYASDLKLDEFDRLFEEMASVLSVQELGEAYLMRAQIKLLASDITLKEDLDMAQQAETAPQFPCLGTKWPIETPNRFIVFPTAKGALAEFTNILPVVAKKFGQWYGNAGKSMVRQVQSAILYFSSEFEKAIEVEKAHQNTDKDGPADKFLSQCTLFRSYLATGRLEEAEEAMLETIRLSKLYPDCIGSYQAFRQWANLTTGWSGDNPRYLNGPDGKRLPFFEDRAEAMRKGISHPLAVEEPFIEYASRHIGKTFTMRDYYVDLFHAMVWFQAGDVRQAETWFLRLYQIALDSGIYVPFVECGKQIAPLLQYIRQSGAPCSSEWLDMVESLSEQYEDALDKYRM